MTNYEQVKRWRKNNPDKVNAQAQRYRQRHPETGDKARKKFRLNNLEKIREKDRLTAAIRRNTPEYKEQQKIRNRRFSDKKRKEKEEIAGRPKPSECELCHTREMVALVGRIVFDHSHETGQFRGWICDRCNKVLGLVRDNIELLKSMTNYLETNRG